MTRQPRRTTFAEIVQRARQEPSPPRPLRPGLGADGRWTDPSGHRYERVDQAVAPGEAMRLAGARTTVVLDACGCGGRQCPTPLRWLTDAELADLRGTTPDVHPPRDGRAAIEHWTSSDGGHLLVLVGQVSWGAVGR